MSDLEHPLEYFLDKHDLLRARQVLMVFADSGIPPQSVLYGCTPPARRETLNKLATRRQTCQHSYLSVSITFIRLHYPPACTAFCSINRRAAPLLVQPRRLSRSQRLGPD
ncbi:hypothetical protein J6590_006307 [Homalodisca vitripennis]|nr:hypothetical protein J6590_006307 [Homalodisca vitripennis]